ncbi:MAG: hypothetical protein ACRD4Y_00930 [Candidatus Acidiferrales bacterium]
MILPFVIDTNKFRPQIESTANGSLKQGDLKIGNAVAHLRGTFNNSGETPSVEMKLNGENMPASDLEAVLPALGVTLPSGASLKEGTISVSLSIGGPVNRLVTTGPVKLSNAKLAGFDLGAKMGELSSFAGIPKGSDTVFETFSSDVRVAPEGIRSDNLNLLVPSIGTVKGNGTISAGQALNFKMIAHQSSSSSPIGRLAGVASLLDLAREWFPEFLQVDRTSASNSADSSAARRSNKTVPEQVNSVCEAQSV